MVEISLTKWYNTFIPVILEDSIVFGRKKKKTNEGLFGAGIDPNCAYCQNSVVAQGEVRCRIGQIAENSCCKKYQYDPLRRAPKGQPKLGEFSAKDFEL